MRRWTVAVSVALTLGAQAISIAQAASDFSGTWRLNQAKSSRAIVGNTPDIQFASQLEVKQSATDLAIVATSVRQQPVSAVYKLDGSKVNVQAPEGITETGEAKLNGTTARHHLTPVVLVARRRHRRRLQGSVDPYRLAS
jgi:hypothetical protein